MTVFKKHATGFRRNSDLDKNPMLRDPNSIQGGFKIYANRVALYNVHPNFLEVNKTIVYIISGTSGTSELLECTSLPGSIPSSAPYTDASNFSPSDLLDGEGLSTVQKDSVALAFQPALNFVGSYFTVVGNGGNSSVDISLNLVESHITNLGATVALNSDTDASEKGWVIDEDSFVSNSATKVPTQQSVKAYVDNYVSSPTSYQGGYDADTNTPDLDSSPGSIDKGSMYTVTVAGDFFIEAVEIGDVLIANVDNPASLGEWTIVQGNLAGALIADNNLSDINSAATALSNLGGVGTSGTPSATELAYFSDSETVTGDPSYDISTVGNFRTLRVRATTASAASAISLGTDNSAAHFTITAKGSSYTATPNEVIFRNSYGRQVWSTGTSGSASNRMTLATTGVLTLTAAHTNAISGDHDVITKAYADANYIGPGSGILDNLEDAGVNVQNSSTGTGFFQWDNVKLEGSGISVDDIFTISSSSYLLLAPSTGFTARANNTHTANISDDNDLITKGYADINYGGSGASIGTAGQIGYTNSEEDDLDYSDLLTFDPASALAIGDISIFAIETTIGTTTADNLNLGYNSSYRFSIGNSGFFPAIDNTYDIGDGTHHIRSLYIGTSIVTDGDISIGNYPFNTDQTVGAGQDDYVLTYNNGTGLISLEAASGGAAFSADSQTQITPNTPILLDEASGNEIAFDLSFTVDKAAGQYHGIYMDVTETDVNNSRVFAQFDANGSPVHYFYATGQVNHFLTDSSTNTTLPVLNLHRRTSGISGDDSLGGSIAMFIHNSAKTLKDHSLEWSWNDSADGEEDSSIILQGWVAGTRTNMINSTGGQSTVFNTGSGSGLQMGATSTSGTSRTLSVAGSETNIDLTLSPKGSGNINLGNFPFNADQTVGAGQDNYVLTYDHGTGLIGLESASSSLGELSIAGGTISNATDNDIFFDVGTVFVTTNDTHNASFFGGASTDFGSGSGVIRINNGTTPPSTSPANAVTLYAEDVSSSSELKVRDEAGNVTTLSPHNFSKIPEGKSEEMAWGYYSERNDQYINVDMAKAIRTIEEQSKEIEELKSLVYKLLLDTEYEKKEIGQLIYTGTID